MRADAQNTVEEIEKSLELLKQRLDWETAEFRLEEFNARVEDPDLWNDADAAQKLMRERQTLVDAMGVYTSIKQELSDNIELIELGEMEDDEEVVTEAEQALAGNFGIRSIPTTAAFKDGIGVFMQPGALPEKALRALIGKLQSLDMDEVRAELEAEEAKEAS